MSSPPTPSAAPGATRTPAISSSGISAQLIRLLPPPGCPGHPLWVPPNEVLRWEQLGFSRAPVPADALELSWLPAPTADGDPADAAGLELVLNPRQTPPAAVTLDWGDGCIETCPWQGRNGNGRARHSYATRTDYTITAELSDSGISATLLVSLAGCPIWQPDPAPLPPPLPPRPPGELQPLIPGPGLAGVPYDGSRSQQWGLLRWSGGPGAGGVPPSDGSTSSFLRADGVWAIPPGSGGGSGSRWWSGDGPPADLPQAAPGDYYLDGRSGDFYVLEA